MQLWTCWVRRRCIVQQFHHGLREGRQMACGSGAPAFHGGRVGEAQHGVLQQCYWVGYSMLQPQFLHVFTGCFRVFDDQIGVDRGSNRKVDRFTVYFFIHYPRNWKLDTCLFAIYAVNWDSVGLRFTIGLP